MSDSSGPHTSLEEEQGDALLRKVAYVDRVDPREVVPVPTFGTVIGGRYQLAEEIGRGGLGIVFAATHRVTGKRVALKWLAPRPGSSRSLHRRLLREARSAASIDHPHVVSIYDAGTHGRAAFIAMELLEGSSLRARLKRGAVPEEEALRIVLGVTQGVRAAHAKGILHRDLKPDNIFLCQGESGQCIPKLLDFGMSRIARPASDPRSASGGEAVAGTPAYMAVEQLMGEHELDARVDVYALGVTLYEMLAGRRPFAAATYEELIVQIAAQQPPDIRDLNQRISPPVARVVMRAMARRAQDRFHDVAHLQRALRAALAHPPAPAPRKRATALLWAAVALALAGVGIYHAASRTLPEQTPVGVGSPQAEVEVSAARQPRGQRPEQAAPSPPTGKRSLTDSSVAAPEPSPPEPVRRPLNRTRPRRGPQPRRTERPARTARPEPQNTAAAAVKSTLDRSTTLLLEDFVELPQASDTPPPQASRRGPPPNVPSP